MAGYTKRNGFIFYQKYCNQWFQTSNTKYEMEIGKHMAVISNLTMYYCTSTPYLIHPRCQFFKKLAFLVFDIEIWSGF